MVSAPKPIATAGPDSASRLTTVIINHEPGYFCLIWQHCNAIYSHTPRPSPVNTTALPSGLYLPEATQRQKRPLGQLQVLKFLFNLI